MAADVTVGTVSVQLKRVNTISGSQNANPLYGTYAPGDISRLYLIQQGTVDANPDIQAKLLYINPAVVDSPVSTLVDLSVKLPGFVDITHFEKGLLAVAFHPDFNDAAKPGYLKFYTYTNENYAQSASAYGETLDYKHAETAASLPIPGTLPQNWINNVATLREWTANSTTPTDATPSRVLMRIADPQNQHNGGTLAFSPNDGYLYWSLGDGGGNSSNSPEFDSSKGGINSTTDGHTNMTSTVRRSYPHGNAQDRTTPLGKMLRINPIECRHRARSKRHVPAPNGQYQIPKDNPFTMESNINPEHDVAVSRLESDLGRRDLCLWTSQSISLQLRSRQRPERISNRGKLYLADAGWNDREEIDLIEKGKNYGWIIREGTEDMAGTILPARPIEIPVYTAPINAVTGLPDTLTDPIGEYHESVGDRDDRRLRVAAIVDERSVWQVCVRRLAIAAQLAEWQRDAVLLRYERGEKSEHPISNLPLGHIRATQLPSGADLARHWARARTARSMQCSTTGRFTNSCRRQSHCQATTTTTTSSTRPTTRCGAKASAQTTYF